MQLSFKSVVDLNFVEIAELFNLCFEDYVIPIHMTAEAAATRSRRDGIDHARSFVTLSQEDIVAIALVAPQGDVARLAGMGVVKAARGEGIGRATVAEFLRKLRKEGFREAVLEVFEQNEAAVRLYSSFGFVATQRLFGYQREPFEPQRGKGLRGAPVSDYLEALCEAEALCEPAMPFIQGSRQAAAIALPTCCWTVDGDAFACFAPPPDGKPLVLTSLVTRPHARGKGKGRELFDAIQDAFKGSPWFLPQIFPESVDGFLHCLGFHRLELNQFEMRLML